MPSGNRPLTTGLHSGIRSSEPNCRLIPPRSSLLHTCSRRSRCPTSASHSSRPTVGLGACGLELSATCPGEVILQIRDKNRGKDNPSGRRCSLLPTMSSSERESRKLLRCKEGSYWPIALFAAAQHFRLFRGKADINGAGHRTNFVGTGASRVRWARPLRSPPPASSCERCGEGSRAPTPPHHSATLRGGRGTQPPRALLTNQTHDLHMWLYVRC
jgi:hypothetical protein